jgi:hypothetical protein
VWIAWDEAGANWGKDAGRGDGIYESRDVRVIVVTDAGALAPPPIGRWLAARSRESLEHPRLLADVNGNVWCLIRRRHQSDAWDYVLYRYTGNPSHAVSIPFSHGRNDVRADLSAAPSGRLVLAWSGDGRTVAPSPAFTKNDIYTADMPGVPYTEPTLHAWFDDKSPNTPAVRSKENQDVLRMASARVEWNGKKLRPLKGELQIQSLPGSGASLEDHYRYAMDAAAFDFAVVTGTPDSADREYLDWLEHKYADLFLLPGRFTPLFGLKCSEACAPASRTFLWAQRGQRARVMDADNRPVETIDQYLRRSGGLAILNAHVDLPAGAWKGIDLALEPLAAVRPAAIKPVKPQIGPHPANPLWAAWSRGSKVGAAASSSEASTYGAYTVVLAETNDRQSILDAMRARHSYGATDNILLNFQSGGHIQGDVFSSSDRPQLNVTAEGTSPFVELEILRGSRVVLTKKLNASSLSLEFRPADAAPHETCYFLRVVQKNGQFAWSSPMWISHP